MFFEKPFSNVVPKRAGQSDAGAATEPYGVRVFVVRKLLRYSLQRRVSRRFLWYENDTKFSATTRIKTPQFFLFLPLYHHGGSPSHRRLNGRVFKS
jgi:hypothetical protein